MQDFAQSLTVHDLKTVSAYLSALRNFIRWSLEQPGGNPFLPESITETAIISYLSYMTTNGRAPRTRNQTLTSLRRFCRWAMGEGYMTHNPANQIQPPVIVNTAPRELRATICTEESSRNHAISTPICNFCSGLLDWITY